MDRIETAPFLLLDRLPKNPEMLPLACCVDGIRHTGIPSENLSLVQQDPGNGVRLLTATGTIPGTSLELSAEIRSYARHPVVEWTVRMTNRGAEKSPLVTDFYAVDAVLPGGNPVITHSNGDSCDCTLYTERDTDLSVVPHFEQRPIGGRSCDCALPFYRVLCDGFGYNLSVGWPGQWESSFDRERDGFRFRAKQQDTRFFLLPGESVRTPRISVMVFKGGRDSGINCWRHWMTEHIIPKADGRPIPPRIFFGKHDKGVEFEETTEEEQLDFLKLLKKQSFLPDALWIDAGWYICSAPGTGHDWHFTGRHEADPERFPSGLKPIGDFCRDNHMDFLAWFEPERVKMGLFEKDYPEGWLLKLKDYSVFDNLRLVGACMKLYDGMALLNLADPACCRWLTDAVDKVIKESGITIFRQDMNFSPLDWWRQNDDPDRSGITENQYIQGLLRFWDGLLERNPGLWINSVSSGGRRADLEVLSRSVSLHQSDYGHGNHPILQAIREFADNWEVYSGNLVMDFEDERNEYHADGPQPSLPEHKLIDNFKLHCAFAPGMALFSGWASLLQRLDMQEEEFKRNEEYRRYMAFRAVWKRAVPLTFSGDYHLLSASGRTNLSWYAVQFHDERQRCGFFQTIRNSRCPDESFTAYLKWIDPEKRYLLESPEFGRSAEMSGSDLLEKGFTVTLPQRTGEIWFYSEI